jgi:hypothetical protein
MWVFTVQHSAIAPSNQSDRHPVDPFDLPGAAPGARPAAPTPVRPTTPPQRRREPGGPAPAPGSGHVDENPGDGPGVVLGLLLRGIVERVA